MDKVLVAKAKLSSGALMDLGEVAALLSVNPRTVHALPLESIRIGRLLRFDPSDVRKLIDYGREPVVKREE